MMTELSLISIEQLLTNFLVDKPIDVQQILNDHPEWFDCHIKYKKYDQSINGPVAKLICNYQDTLYKVASFLKYGKRDVRCLSKEERKTLEIVFEVRKGSSDLWAKICKQIREILNMVPEKQRATILIVLILALTCGYSLKQYLNHEERMTEINLVNNAMNKVSETNKDLVELANESRKNLINILPTIDDEVEFQGENYTQEDFKTIRKTLYPRKPTEKRVETISGDYKVIEINIKKHYVSIENQNGETTRILYSDDLVSNMEDFRTRFKQAIDDEGKIFHIKASRIVKDNKKGDLQLNEIKEIQ